MVFIVTLSYHWFIFEITCIQSRFKNTLFLSHNKQQTCLSITLMFTLLIVFCYNIFLLFVSANISVCLIRNRMQYLTDCRRVLEFGFQEFRISPQYFVLSPFSGELHLETNTGKITCVVLDFKMCFSLIWLIILPYQLPYPITVEMEMNKHKNVMKPRMPRTVLLSLSLSISLMCCVWNCIIMDRDWAWNLLLIWKKKAITSNALFPKKIS